MWPVVIAVRMAVSLRNTEMNTLLPIQDTTGGDTMEIKCPYCGSEEYEVYDTCGGSGENIQELCACLDCDKQFSVIYVVDCIVKES